MGGLGSGTYYRGNNKTYLEEVRRIDLNFMKKKGMLRPGNRGTLTWFCGGEQAGLINYRTEYAQLVLNYRYREYGEEWTPYEEHVLFDRTPCNYGGERLWFLCPHCNRRVGILVGEGVRFLCRHCYGLPYSSQGETPYDRKQRKLLKLEERIFGDGDCKVKGMHWKTFDRLYNQYQQLDWAAEQDLWDVISRLRC